MNVEWVLDDGDELHLESGLRYTTLCGETLVKNRVDRELFELDEHAGHDRRCRECVLEAHEAADERRRST